MQRSRAIAKEEDDDLDNPLNAPLYYDGSSRVVQSTQEGLRVCLARASVTATKLEQLMKVTQSTMVALELVQTMQEYSGHLNKRDALVRRDGAAPASPERDLTNYDQGAGLADPAVVVVSKEFGEYPVAVVDPLRCEALHGVSGKVRFPTVPSASVEVLADHLNASDFNVPQSLSQLQADTHTAERLLEMALQLKAPLLALRLATIIFGTQQGPSSFFTASAALQLRTLFQEGFLFGYSIKDWLHMEVLGGDPVTAAMDVLWWIRFLKEAVADEGERRDGYADHEGTWKQTYAETRIRVFLSFGVHAVSKDEVTLWAHSLGRYVEYMSLRDTSVADAELEVLATCCPNLKSVDLSYTGVGQRTVELLAHHCPNLVECSVTGCDLMPEAQDLLRRHCVENKRRAVEA